MKEIVSLVFLLFILALLFGAKKREKKSPVWLQILLGLLGGFIFLIIYSLVDFSFDIAEILERLLLKLASS